LSDEPIPIEQKPPRTTGEALVEGERWKDYGDPKQAFPAIAKAWSAILGQTVEAHTVALCLIAVKLVREAKSHKPDNLDDIEGYVEIARRLKQG